MQRKLKYLLTRGLENVFLILINIGITYFSNAQTFIENRFIDKKVKSKKYSTQKHCWKSIKMKDTQINVKLVENRSKIIQS